MRSVEKRRLKGALIAGALLLVALVSAETHRYRYKRVIYYHQQMSESRGAGERDSLNALCERLVGRAGYNPYALPVRPKEKHFWDAYNDFWNYSE